MYAVLTFIFERGYPIGYLMSGDHEMFLDNKMVVASSCSVNEAIQEPFVFFQMW